MSSKVNGAALATEVDRVHRRRMLRHGDVNKVQCAPQNDSDPLENERREVGAAIKEGIGDAPLKEYGTKSLMSGLVSGDAVPDYLARLYQDPNSRRRFGRRWLRGDDAVRVKTIIEWDEEKVG